MKIIDDGDLTAIDEAGDLVAWIDGGWLDEIAEKKKTEKEKNEQGTTQTDTGGTPANSK
jgi:hypothetical protein